MAVAPLPSAARDYVAVLASPAIQLVPIKPGGVRLRPPTGRDRPRAANADGRDVAAGAAALPARRANSEIRRLRVLGFLVDPNAIAPTEVQDRQPSLNTFNLAEVRNPQVIFIRTPDRVSGGGPCAPIG
jgi:hypothetical protein